jgi:hypothetical protein
MCTVSWTLVDGGYHLLFNRDERTTRGRAVPPEVHDVRGVRAIAPLDSDFGGTWIGANELGVSVCLLNRYDATTGPLTAPALSRGLLVLDLLDVRSRIEVRERLSESRLERFQPFTLLALAPGEPALVARWSGRHCLFEYVGEFSNPLVSWSFDPAGVAASRKREFEAIPRQDGRLAPEALAALHHSHEPAPGPFSVCMHRDDASTVSLSWIEVARDRVEFRYVDGPPCAGRPAGQHAIPRRAGDRVLAGSGRD